MQTYPLRNSGALSAWSSSLSCILNLSSLLGPSWHTYMYVILSYLKNKWANKHSLRWPWVISCFSSSTKHKTVLTLSHFSPLIYFWISWNLTTKIIPFKVIKHLLPPIAKSLGHCPPGQFWFYFCNISPSGSLLSFGNSLPGFLWYHTLLPSSTPSLSLFLLSHPFPLHGSEILTFTRFFPRPPYLLMLHDLPNRFFHSPGFRNSINVDVSSVCISGSCFLSQKKPWGWILVVPFISYPVWAHHKLLVPPSSHRKCSYNNKTSAGRWL